MKSSIPKIAQSHQGSTKAQSRPSSAHQSLPKSLTFTPYIVIGEKYKKKSTR